MVVPSATPDLVIPERVRQVLENLREASAAFDDVLGLIIYGSLARGEFRDGESNVNLLVSLNQGSAEALRALSEPFRAAWRAVRVEPFLVREAEVPRLADVFPIKLLDIQKHHVVLAGKDPFSGVHVRPEDLRYRVGTRTSWHAWRADHAQPWTQRRWR